MNLLSWRVFSMALLLAFAVATPTVVKAQAQPMTEIPLGSGTVSGGGSAMSAGGTTSLDGGDMGGGGIAAPTTN